jgi:hypothetical protein
MSAGDRVKGFFHRDNSVVPITQPRRRTYRDLTPIEDTYITRAPSGPETTATPDIYYPHDPEERVEVMYRNGGSYVAPFDVVTSDEGLGADGFRRSDIVATRPEDEVGTTWVVGSP